MAALLSSDSGDTERVMIEIEECRAMGLDVLPPDVNESRSQFTVVKNNDHDAIRFGLAAVKGVGGIIGACGDR
jgi:DNA polymerase III subunit alpha